MHALVHSRDVLERNARLSADEGNFEKADVPSYLTNWGRELKY